MIARLCANISIGTEIFEPHGHQQFKCGDIGSVGRVSVIRLLSVTELRGLDKPMNRDVVHEIADLGSCWVSLEDLENGEHNGTRRRSHCGKNAVATVGDVHRYSGDRCVALEVLQGYDPLAANRVDNFSTTCTREETNRKGLTGNDTLFNLANVKRIGALSRKANNV